MSWQSGSKPGDSEQAFTFNKEIMARADVKFISLCKDQKIVAGAVANKSAGVVGLSNIFCNAEEKRVYWKVVTRAVHTLFPDLEIVGYESGDELALALSIGFQELGNLSVWARF